MTCLRSGDTVKDGELSLTLLALKRVSEDKTCQIEGVNVALTDIYLKAIRPDLHDPIGQHTAEILKNNGLLEPDGTIMYNTALIVQNAISEDGTILDIDEIVKPS